MPEQKKPLTAAKVVDALDTLVRWGRESNMAQGQQRPAPPAPTAGAGKVGSDRD